MSLQGIFHAFYGHDKQQAIRTQCALRRVLYIVYYVTLCVIFTAPSAEARKIKTKHSIPKQSQKSIKEATYSSSDSIMSIISDSIAFAEKIRPSVKFYGFDKTIASNYESFFISNELDTRIKGMDLIITYFDMKGRQLHKRNVTLECDIPPHETIRTDIKSWDTQKSFYFNQSARPKRQATPFTVKLDLISITLNP